MILLCLQIAWEESSTSKNVVDHIFFNLFDNVCYPLYQDNCKVFVYEAKLMVCDYTFPSDDRFKSFK